MLSSQSSRTFSGRTVLANESESKLEFHPARTFLETVEWPQACAPHSDCFHIRKPSRLGAPFDDRLSPSPVNQAHGQPRLCRRIRVAHLSAAAEPIEIHRVTGQYQKCSKWDSFSAPCYRTIFE